MAEKSLEQLEQENAELKQQVENLEVENAALKAVAQKQETDIKVLSAKAEGASDVITAEYEGKVYQVLGGAYLSLDGEAAEKLSAADIAGSPEAVAHLVAISSGILKEVK